MVKEEVYDESFFIWHLRLRNFYSDIARWLWSEFRPRNVIDFGCGNGFIISELKKLGASVLGIDCSLNALKWAAENVKDDIKIMDITLPINLGKFDLVISTEVAEHLPENSAQAFVDNLTNHASDIIYFTAAEPGQGGTEHINEKFHEYWTEKFNSKGFIFLRRKSYELRIFLSHKWARIPGAPRWFIWNSMLFKKARKESLTIKFQLIYSRIKLILCICYVKLLIRKIFRKFGINFV